jgi:hypothetical protein
MTTKAKPGELVDVATHLLDDIETAPVMREIIIPEPDPLLAKPGAWKPKNIDPRLADRSKKPTR